MMFPETIEEFIKDYSIVDKKEIYTNGSELIQVFRIKQALAHYYPKENEEERIMIERKKERITREHKSVILKRKLSYVLNKNDYKMLIAEILIAILEEIESGVNNGN